MNRRERELICKSLYEFQQWLFNEAPLFDETFALKDVVVPMRVAVGTVKLEQELESRDTDSRHHQEKKSLDALEALQEWLSSTEPVALLQGTGGMGKTVLSLQFTKLVHEFGTGGTLMPIRIRMRDVVLGATAKSVESLKALERAALKQCRERQPDLLAGGDESSGLLSDPGVLRNAGTAQIGERKLCRYVLILDGWDELALAGTSISDTLLAFLADLHVVLSDHLGELKLLFCGRPLPALLGAALFRDTTPVFTVLPYDEKQQGAAVERFCTARNLGHGLTLPQVSDKSILTHPLLCYVTLRLLAGTSVPGAQVMFGSSTTLYQALVDETCRNAGKAATDTQFDGRKIEKISEEDLRELLQATALALFTAGSKTISRDEWEERLKVLAPDLWKRLTGLTSHGDEGAILAELFVLSYYMQPRASGKKVGDAARQVGGLEFIHTPLQEYLVAEAVVAELESWGTGPKDSQVETYQLGADFAPSSLLYGRSRMVARWWMGTLVDDMFLDHLERLLALKVTSANVESWRQVAGNLRTLWRWWREEGPVRAQWDGIEWHPEATAHFVVLPWLVSGRYSASWAARPVVVQEHLGHALCNVAALVLGSIFQVTGEENDRFAPEDRKTSWAAPMISPRWIDRLGPPNRFSSLRLPAVNLFSAGLYWVCLVGAHLTLANLCRVNLTRADLRWADLTGANLAQADLTRVNLSMANLAAADMTRAKLTRAELSMANLSEADLTGANLIGADLSMANLTKTDLTGTNLSGAIFSPSYLAEKSSAHSIDPDIAALIRTILFWTKLPARYKDNLDFADCIGVDTIIWVDDHGKPVES